MNKQDGQQQIIRLVEKFESLSLSERKNITSQ